MITVRIFLDGQQIDPSLLPQLTIRNPTVDRIVNEIVDRTPVANAPPMDKLS